MNKIEHYSNWCEIDRLDGKDIEDGEKLRIKWPDGTITKETVRVEADSYSMLEQGGAYTDIPTKEAYIEVKDTIHGLKVKHKLFLRAHLNKLRAERV